MSDKTKSSAGQSIVRIYLPHHGYFQGIVTSMSTSGVIVDFPIDAPPSIPANRRIELALSSERLKSSIRLPAMSVDFEDDRYRRRYEFMIEPDAQIALGLLIDGRKECRVSPNVVNPILVMLRQDATGAYMEGLLDDVSRTGISMFVKSGYEGTLSDDDATRISLLLPGDRLPIQLMGFPRHTQEDEGRLRFGLEFTHDYDGHASDMTRYLKYVDGLKDELLRHLRECNLTDEAA